MSAINCHECGRPNSVTARRCIWCSVPFSEDAAATRSGTKSVELHYLEGIDRFDDEGPVRLILGDAGIEVLELMPGSRSVKIPANCLLETRVEDSLTSHNGDDSKSWKRLLKKVPSAGASRNTTGTAKRQSVLTIKYRIDGEIREAVFCRDDQPGASVVAGVAKIIATLAKA